MKHYTTIEQSKKLLELGLNPESADMTYCAVVEDTRDKTSIKGWEVVTGTKKWEVSVNAIKNNSFSYRNGYIVPCWSLGALLEMMLTIKSSKVFHLSIEDGVYFMCYNDSSNGDYEEFVGSNPLEAAYSMVVWLLENGYIKKERDN